MRDYRTCRFRAHQCKVDRASVSFRHRVACNAPVWFCFGVPSWFASKRARWTDTAPGPRFFWPHRNKALFLLICHRKKYEGETQNRISMRIDYVNPIVQCGEATSVRCPWAEGYRQGQPPSTDPQCLRTKSTIALVILFSRVLNLEVSSATGRVSSCGSCLQMPSFWCSRRVRKALVTCALVQLCRLKTCMF